MSNLDSNTSGLNYKTIAAIDATIASIQNFKTAKLDEAVAERELRMPNFDLHDDQILETMISAIVYSNQASAARVKPLIEGGIFAKAFQNYSVKQVAALRPQNVINAHWANMTAIRQKRKVKSMIECAIYLQRHGSFMQFLRKTGLPIRIELEQDITAFWKIFGEIREEFRNGKVPYFQNFISLCYLLMELGFDCTKPDSAVMTAAVTLGIVPEAQYQKKNPKKRANHPETSLRKTVETIQRYAVFKNKRTPVIDLYFLILGQQTGVNEFVDPVYYSNSAVKVRLAHAQNSRPGQ